MLRVLTTVGDIAETEFAERYEYMSSRNDAYFLVVIEDTSREAGTKIVGTGALVVERKLYVTLSVTSRQELTGVVSTSWDSLATLRTSQWPRTSKARNWVCA